MQNSILLENISRDELFTELKEIIDRALQTKLHQEAPTEYITKKEVAEKLRSSLPTITRMTADGTIKGYRFGRRILFKADEIDKALSEISSLKYKRA